MDVTREPVDRQLVGVLALQGDVAEHMSLLSRCGSRARAVLRPRDLTGLDGVVLPGGESTTIGRLAAEAGLLRPLRAMLDAGVPMWGTCAGMILLAEDAGHAQPLIGGFDISVTRNAFGRQVDSFESEIHIDGVTDSGPPFRAVFIRAPAIAAHGPGVRITARLRDGTAVAATQGACMVTAFHPELGDDDRLHRAFLTNVESRHAGAGAGAATTRRDAPDQVIAGSSSAA